MQNGVRADAAIHNAMGPVPISDVDECAFVHVGIAPSRNGADCGLAGWTGPATAVWGRGTGIVESSPVVVGGDDLRGDGGQLVDLSFGQHGEEVFVEVS